MTTNWETEARFGSRTSIVAIGLTVVAIVVAVLVNNGGDEPQGAAHSSVTEAYPASTAHDWATYADDVVVAHLHSKTMLGRNRQATVTLDIDDSVWTRDGAPPAPASMVFSTVVVQGTPQFEPGHQYLLAIVKQGSATPAFAWVPLAYSAIFPYDDDVIGQGEQVGGQTWDSQVRDATEGKSATAVVDLLDEAN